MVFADLKVAKKFKSIFDDLSQHVDFIQGASPPRLARNDTTCSPRRRR